MCVPIVMEHHLAIGITETRRRKSTSVVRRVSRSVLATKLTKEDAGSWRTFQRLILDIRIKDWRRSSVKGRNGARIDDVTKMRMTSAVEIHLRTQRVV